MQMDRKGGVCSSVGKLCTSASCIAYTYVYYEEDAERQNICTKYKTVAESANAPSNNEQVQVSK
jgi:hypothetical protein